VTLKPPTANSGAAQVFTAICWSPAMAISEPQVRGESATETACSATT